MFLQEATLGGGCFWCLEAVYQQLRGVTHVESGYAGGHTSNPDYESVCSGNTGHAEVVRIVFDANIISNRQILEVFFAIHDPTTLNRQGNDIGTQYRSVIYYYNDEQFIFKKQVYTKSSDSLSNWSILNKILSYIFLFLMISSVS